MQTNLFCNRPIAPPFFADKDFRRERLDGFVRGHAVAQWPRSLRREHHPGCPRLQTRLRTVHVYKRRAPRVFLVIVLRKRRRALANGLLRLPEAVLTISSLPSPATLFPCGRQIAPKLRRAHRCLRSYHVRNFLVVDRSNSQPLPGHSRRNTSGPGIARQITRSILRGVNSFAEGQKEKWRNQGFVAMISGEGPCASRVR